MPLIPVVRSVAAMNRDLQSDERPNDTFSASNVVGGAAGALILFFAIVGMMLPE